MGRPVNKQNFGPDGIEVQAKVGSAAAKAGYIVKQTSTHEFIVNVGGKEYTSRMVEKAKGDLAVGEMMIAVTLADGSVVPAKSLKGHVVTAGGKATVWATRTNNAAPSKVARVQEEAPAPTPTPTPTPSTPADPAPTTPEPTPADPDTTTPTGS